MAQVPFALSPALVAIAVDYANINRDSRGYIADRVAPRVTVDGPLFKYPNFPIEEAFTVYDNQVDRLGRLNEVVASAGETTGEVLDYGILSKVAYRDLAAAQAGINAMPIDLKARAVRKVIDVNQLNREIRVSAFTNTAGSYTAGYTSDKVGAPWSVYASSDPVGDVRAAQLTMLIPGNVGVTNRAVMNMLARHPAISVALGGSANSGRIATDQEIATLFGLERIEIGNTLRQTSKRGQALTTAAIWGNNFAIHYQGPLNAINGEALDAEAPSFLHTFQWMGMVSGENEYPGGEMGLLGGVGVYTGEMVVEKRVAPFAGYLFQNVMP